jgi:hypothetical protein
MRITEENDALKSEIRTPNGDSNSPTSDFEVEALTTK